MYLLGAVLGLRCCAQPFSSWGKWGYSSLLRTGFSLWWVLFCGAQALRCRGLVTLYVRDLSRVPVQRLNLCPLRRPADS